MARRRAGRGAPRNVRRMSSAHRPQTNALCWASRDRQQVHRHCRHPASAGVPPSHQQVSRHRRYEDARPKSPRRSWIRAWTISWPSKIIGTVLTDEVGIFFQATERSCGNALDTIDVDHSRIVTRRHWVGQNADWLTTGARVPRRPAISRPVSDCPGGRHGRTQSRRYTACRICSHPASSNRACWPAPFERMGDRKSVSIACSTF